MHLARKSAGAQETGQHGHYERRKHKEHQLTYGRPECGERRVPWSVGYCDALIKKYLDEPTLN